jgi:hypothetical protein
MVSTVTSQPIASRRLKPSALQRISEAVLIIGTVGAVVAASGPLWAVRLGVAMAIVAALMACAFAWRDLNAARHGHAKAMLQASREHGATLREERYRNAAVVDALSMRIADAGKVIERQRTRIAQQRLEISSLNQDRAYFKDEVANRDVVISALRDAVREYEEALIAPLEESDAEVHHLPRRILAGHDFVWQELSAEDDTADMVLPNYEVDRQPA